MDIEKTYSPTLTYRGVTMQRLTVSQLAGVIARWRDQDRTAMIANMKAADLPAAEQYAKLEEHRKDRIGLVEGALRVFNDPASASEVVALAAEASKVEIPETFSPADITMIAASLFGYEASDFANASGGDESDDSEGEARPLALTEPIGS